MVEDGFHVCSRAGDFLGYVERVEDGSYLATSLAARAEDTYPDLASAMHAVAGPIDPLSSDERSSA